jgi:hypothetical protein
MILDLDKLLKTYESHNYVMYKDLNYGDPFFFFRINYTDDFRFYIQKGYGYNYILGFHTTSSRRFLNIKLTVR